MALVLNARAQDTLKLNLRQAEQLFIAGNHRLIAGQFEIDQAKAEVITAKLFDNPEISHENLFYNHETRKFLETSYVTGQYNTSVSQLIRLARKRSKNIELAREGVKLSSYGYFDLMRNLRFELRSTFYKAYYHQQSANLYQVQVKALEQLLRASELQLGQGNIAQKEVIRIKSLLYGLKSEYTSLLNEQEDLQAELKMLINAAPSAVLSLSLPQDQVDAYKPEDLKYAALLDSARANRADLLLAKTQIAYAEKNLILEKANAIPDISLSFSYDLKGSYPDHYTGIGITVPIPLFNRNQGEIKKARIAVEAGNNALAQTELQLQTEIFNSYQTARRTEKTYQEIDKDFGENFQTLMEQVSRHFSSRNISLIEFLNFYEAYKDNVLQLNNLKYERLNAREQLNYVTGSNLFK